MLTSVDDWYYDEKNKSLIIIMEGTFSRFGQDVRMLIKTSYRVDEKKLIVKRKKTRVYSLINITSDFLGVMATKKKQCYFVFNDGMYVPSSVLKMKKVLEPFSCDVTNTLFRNVTGLSKENLQTLQMYGAII